MEPVTAFADGACSVICDNRFLPVHITIWRGAVSAALVDRYFEWHHAFMGWLRDEGQVVVQVADASASERPTATVRRKIAEITKAAPTWHAEVSLQSHVVITSPLVRGVLTAISWFDPSILDSKVVSSMSEGLTQAAEVLRRRDLSIPSGLDIERYEPPDPAQFEMKTA